MNKLILIGNGFDLAHGLKTSYRDFLPWYLNDLIAREPKKNGICPLPPFKWDEDRRALLRAERYIWYALPYSLERDKLRCILDPQDVHGPYSHDETIRVLKAKEIRRHGEYRTRRLVLAAYDRLRPTWDMEAHLKRLKEVWEECQGDLSIKNKTYKKPSPSTPKAK